MGRGTLWFTGLSGAGKSTVAATLKTMLDALGVDAFVLDGDDLRQGLNADLDYTEESRRENVRRVGEVAMLFANVEHLALVTLISPFASGRDAVRARHEELGIPFFEVHVATPIEVCEERDPKRLYQRARRGEVPAFTGLTSPYEPPTSPELVLSTVGETPEESAKAVLVLLDSAGLSSPDRS